MMLFGMPELTTPNPSFWKLACVPGNDRLTGRNVFPKVGPWLRISGLGFQGLKI